MSKTIEATCKEHEWIDVTTFPDLPNRRFICRWCDATTIAGHKEVEKAACVGRPVCGNEGECCR